MTSFFKMAIIPSLLLSLNATAFADSKDDCLAEYNKMAAKQNSSTFYGYGTGYGEQDAVDNARVDLAKQIRTNIKAEASVSENNKDVSLDSLTTSTVSESLVGLKVHKRCPMGAKMSAFVSLTRTAFLGNLKSSLQSLESTAQGQLAALTTAPSALERLRTIRQVKLDLTTSRDKFREDLALCQAFRSCHDIDGKVFTKLEDEVAKNRSLLLFSYKALDDAAKALRQDLTRLLEREGYEFTNQPSKSEAQIRCDQKFFPKVKDIAERYLEIKCVSELMVDGSVAFTMSFSGSGAGESQEQAFDFARNQLQLDDKIHD